MWRPAFTQISLLSRSIIKASGNNFVKFFATEARFDIKPYKLHRFKYGPEQSVSLSKNDAVKLYTQMETIRRMEAAASTLYTEKVIRGFCHLYSGQEACAVGMKAAVREQDCIITAYRSHGWTYLMGQSVLGVLAELAGREKGCGRGKGGSMHMYAQNFFGGNGIVGAQVPIGTGIALACKYKENKGVCLVLYGDGAANQGQVHESYNMAGLWKLPCVYVCENNGYGMGTSAERSSYNPNYFTRGDLIPGIWVDGMDVLAVKNATQFAINFAINCGPIVLEMATYRYFGHSMSDPGTSYRSREEIQEVRQTRDPITSFKEKILHAGLTTPEEMKAIESNVKKEIDKASTAAKEDKEVAMEELAADVYLNNLHPKIRNIIDHTLDHQRTGSEINRKDSVVKVSHQELRESEIGATGKQNETIEEDKSGGTASETIKERKPDSEK